MSLSPRKSPVSSLAEWLIPAGLFVLFLLITLPGIAWGAPDLWHPDEIVKEAGMALDGDYQFDEENFDYPSLPKYVLYGIGKVVYSLGYDRADFIIAARSLSAGAGRAGRRAGVCAGAHAWWQGAERGTGGYCC